MLRVGSGSLADLQAKLLMSNNVTDVTGLQRAMQFIPMRIVECARLRSEASARQGVRSQKHLVRRRQEAMARRVEYYQLSPSAA